MRIDVLPVLSDNYTYLVVVGDHCAIVDPAEAAPVLDALGRLRLTAECAVVTHNHADHTGGCLDLKRATGCRLLGPDSHGISGLDERVGEGSTIDLHGVILSVMSVPGHTATDVAYLVESSAVFTGDVLINGACGRVMGASYEQMFASLNRLRSLPDTTLVYGGHEYTLDNLEFAAHVDPTDVAVLDRLERVRLLRRAGRPAVPSTMADEKQTNPFLRAGLTVDEFAALRRRKDAW